LDLSLECAPRRKFKSFTVKLVYKGIIRDRIFPVVSEFSLKQVLVG